MKKQRGFSVAIIMVLLTIAVLIAITLLTVLIKATGSSGQGTSNDKRPQTSQSQNKPDAKVSQNQAQGSNSQNQPLVKNDIQDLSTGYLVCINLNGVNYPRTPALDRRVAERWLAVKQELDTKGIPPLSFTWGFRTNCQQVNVKTSYTKAIPGTSPHEAGRALDANNMRTRRDRDTIVAIFRDHGWVWLGPTKDPPHFEIEGYSVGEPSHRNWIKKAQTDYQQGGPHGGCRGSECGD